MAIRLKDAARNGESGVVRIVDHFNRTVTQKPFTVDALVVNVTFSCGTVNRAGNYRIEFVIDRQSIDQVNVQAVWPPISLQAPSEMLNYRSPFSVKIQWIHLKCYPPASVNLIVRADVVHCGYRNSSCPLDWPEQIRSSSPVTDVWQTHGIIDVRFGCQALSRPGFYRVALRTGEDDVIGVSNVIHVTMNTDFQLQVGAQYARPHCPAGGHFAVFYQHPVCTGANDRVRLFAKVSANVSASASGRPYRLDYLGEQPLASASSSSSSSLALPCQLIDGRHDFDALCFRYVNIADDKSVTDISQVCIPSHNTSSKSS